jgi:hypothetical protein
MSARAIVEVSLGVKRLFFRALRTLAANQRCSPAWLAAFLIFLASPLWAQTFTPSASVGVGIQTSYQNVDPTGGSDLNQFALDHARIYLSGTITPNISAMFNTDYSTVTNNIEILDAAGQFSISPKLNVWFGRFLPPSDRANLYGPFYANEWAVYTDGIQDGYPFVFQGRDNGAMYWGDFKEGIAKIKVSLGGFDGASATGNTDVIGAARVQIDFWDPESGYYLNGTYYGDKNLLAIGGATQWQGTKTATTADFLMERKVMGGGAFTIESEYSRYNRLGGYNASYAKSEGGYGLASFLIPKQVGVGKFEVLGKFAQADFTNGIVAPAVKNPNYHQRTTEIDFDYVIKQFDARLMSFFKDTRFNAVNSDFFEAGIGLQFQISKDIH